MRMAAMWVQLVTLSDHRLLDSCPDRSCPTHGMLKFGQPFVGSFLLFSIGIRKQGVDGQEGHLGRVLRGCHDELEAI